MTFEDGFHLLLPKIKEYGAELVKLIEVEKNPRIKSRFVELLGECDDPKFIPIFVNLLSSDVLDIVAWSLTSLENLSSGNGKMIANDFRKKNPFWLK